MFLRAKMGPVPEVGEEAPEFSLPSAQGGQFRLSMRTVRGPVVVAFYRPGDEEDVEYFKALAGKEDEINLAAGSVVAIGVAEPDPYVRVMAIQTIRRRELAGLRPRLVALRAVETDPVVLSNLRHLTP